MELKRIGTIYTDLPEKFGLPRQSTLAEHLKGWICFEEPYGDPRAFEGIEEYDYLWLLWGFDVPEGEFRPRVRPPRLGGNEYRGVFATRSPFRPNPLAMSCVRLERVLRPGDAGYAEARALGTRPGSGVILEVSGIDMRSGTSVYDIKPYLPYVEAHPDARGGFSDLHADDRLQVEIPDTILSQIPADKQDALLEILSQDPRPAYQDDPSRTYGLAYAGLNITFRVEEDCVHVISVEE
jgi:tRNA-Thr(GGU) m(6)t(6)A37 methyltransferase TsaA